MVSLLFLKGRKALLPRDRTERGVFQVDEKYRREQTEAGGVNIIVCIKQVPGSSNVKVDEKTGLLVRSAKGNKLNPYDLYAIETALTLREKTGGTVTAVSMGPPQAGEALSECIWMGCDAGCLLSDRAFGGADVLATSYTISCGIKKIGNYDLILCGKQTTDGDTAQVGAEMAEHLGIPHLSNVISVMELGDKTVTVKALQENMIVTEELELPCLLCMDAEVNTPRLPSYKRRKAMTGTEISVLSLSDLADRDPGHYGLKGSPTQVQKIFPPEKKTDRVMVRGESGELAEKMADLLRDKKFI